MNNNSKEATRYTIQKLPTTLQVNNGIPIICRT